MIGVSDNGLADNKLGLTWFENVFEKHIAYYTKDVYRLDSLSLMAIELFHSRIRFILQRKFNYILCMPLHFSYLLQPLDVGYFAVLKQSYGRLIEGYMRNGVNHIDKYRGHDPS